MTNKNIDSLNSFGYVLLQNMIPPDRINEIKNELERQSKNLNSNEILHQQEDQLILKNVFSLCPTLFLPLLDIDEIKLILSDVFTDGYILQSMNASRANPIGDNFHELRAHIDSRLPVKEFSNTLALGVAYCIDDFTEDNGATRVWPFSHLSGKRPEYYKEIGLSIPNPITVTAKAGDIMIFASHLWHAVGPNRTQNARWGIFTFFNPWWMKPTYDYTDCGEELFNLLTLHQKQLFGFNSQVPSMHSSRNYTKTKIDDLPNEYINAKRIN